MDLSLIQTHIDNFVDTWEGWGKVFGAFFDEKNVFTQLASVVNTLSGEVTSSTFFPNTDAVVDANEKAAEAAN